MKKTQQVHLQPGRTYIMHSTEPRMIVFTVVSSGRFSVGGAEISAATYEDLAAPFAISQGPYDYEPVTAPKIRKPFITWLRQQEIRGDDIGRLSRHVSRDSSAPRSAVSKQEWSRYFQSDRRDLAELFERAWREFVAAEGACD